MRLKDGKLPEGFVLAKPIAQENYDESIIYELERRGRLIIERKRDGWKMFALKGSSRKVRLFTDGLNEVDSRFNHIKSELEKMNLPDDTVLVGEAVVDLTSTDDVTKVISIFHSSTEKSIQFQKTNGMAKFMVFGGVMPCRTGVELSYDSVYSIISNLFKMSNTLVHVFPAQALKVGFDEAKRMVIEMGWEGLVLYDKEYRLTYRTDGKNPTRPKGCYKWKPIMEDDFIVREWIPRPGTKTVKELVLLQIDPLSSKEFYCGKLVSFSNQIRQELAGMKYPIVVQARFDMRFAKTGKIRNPRFMRTRDDKERSACIAPKSYPSAKYQAF